MTGQMPFAEEPSLSRRRKQTKRERFLVEMDVVVPWSRLVALIKPYYPKAGSGRKPMPLERMLRIHFLQQWFGYSDPGMEEALYEIPLLNGKRPMQVVVAAMRKLLHLAFGVLKSGKPFDPEFGIA